MTRDSRDEWPLADIIVTWKRNEMLYSARSESAEFEGRTNARRSWAVAASHAKKMVQMLERVDRHMADAILARLHAEDADREPVIPGEMDRRLERRKEHDKAVAEFKDMMKGGS